MAELTRPPLREDPSVYVLAENEEDPSSAPPAAAERPAAPPGPQPLRSLRRHKRLAVLAFLAAAAAWTPVLFWMHVRRTYAAESLLLVSPVFARNLNEDREFQLPRYEEFVNQQLILLGREDVALAALDRLGPDAARWIRPGETRREAAGRLAASLQAKRVPTTSYIAVRLEGPSPEGLAPAVNAAVDAFLAFAKSQPFYGLGVRLEALHRQKARLQEEIRAKTETLARWTREYGVSGFERNPHAAALQDADRSVQEARRKRLEAEARLAGAKSRQDIAERLDVDLQARELLGADLELNGLRTALLARKSDIKAKLMGLTAEHPGRGAGEKMLAEIDEELARTEAAVLERIRALLVQRRDARLKEEIQAAWLDLEQCRRFEGILSTESRALSQKATRFNEIYYEALDVQQDLERLRKQLTAIDDRLDLMRLETDAPGFVHLVGQATAPREPLPAKTSRWAALAGCSALGFALLAPFAFDLLSRRVYGPSDVEGLLPGATLLWLPERRRRTEAFARDQIRRLAIALDRELRLSQLSVFVLTPLRVPGGTFGLALDVGRELEAIGRRTLVVEANILEPDLRHGPPEGRPGLVSVLAGRTRIEDAVVPAGRGLPDRIPVGPAGGRTLLPNAAALRGLVDRLAHRYQIVLIDAPPLLVSSDAELLAGVSDGAILVAEARRSRLKDVAQAVDQLQRTGRPLIASVLHRVTAVSRHGGIPTPM